MTANPELPQQDSGGIELSPRGAILHTEYAARTIMIYAISEDDLEILSSHDTRAKVFFAIGSACLSLAAGIIIAGLMATDLPPEGHAALKVVAPFLVIATVISYGFGILRMVSARVFNRKSETRKD